MPSVIQAKAQLRTECRQRRKAMTAQEKDQADSLIFQRARDILQSRWGNYLYCYVSMPGTEVDTLQLIDLALEKQVPVVVPKCVTGSCTLEHYLIEDRRQLQKGFYGIMEPDPSVCRKIEAPHEGVCIVPGLAFDITGVRMGYGKGYYDRFLAEFQGLKIGLCYEHCFFTQRIPHEPFDAVMDIVVTDRRVSIIRQKG